MVINRNTLPWDDWVVVFRVEFARAFGCGLKDAGYDAYTFREMYDDGLTPADAVSEEIEMRVFVALASTTERPVS